eukprot:2961093-Rhodomonas_salina.1
MAVYRRQACPSQRALNLTKTPPQRRTEIKATLGMVASARAQTAHPPFSDSVCVLLRWRLRALRSPLGTETAYPGTRSCRMRGL